MKKSLLIIAALALFAVSCSQYTCPTYAKADVDKKQEVKKEARNF